MLESVGQALPLVSNAGIPVLSPNDLHSAFSFPFFVGGPASGELSPSNGRFGGRDGPACGGSGVGNEESGAIGFSSEGVRGSEAV
jgi:hypothetical protein